MANSIIVGLLTLLMHSALAQTDSVVKDPVTDPHFSLRCKELLYERNQKVKMRQKFTGLLQRNQNLLKSIPEERKASRARLDANGIRIKGELERAQLEIAEKEESIIRSGCPGINL